MDAATARREAAHILSERRFHRHEVPRPFRGLLHALSQIVEPVVQALGELFEQPLIGWPLAAVIVLAALLLVARAVRRGGGGGARARGGGGGGCVPPRAPPPPFPPPQPRRSRRPDLVLLRDGADRS